MNQRLQKIKNHVQENKAVYIAAAAGVAVGAVGFAVVSRVGGTSVTVDSWKLFEFKWKSPTTNVVETILTRRGHPGNMVLCNETGEVFASQGRAAELLGLDASALSRHLNGKRDAVKGLTFANLGEAKAA